MSAVQPFDFNGLQVRIITDGDGSPWFVASDVARVLGYRDAFNLTRRIHPDDRGTHVLSTPSGEQAMTTLTEPGLYVAVMGSEVSGARDFQRWITHDVLPSLRKTGSYAIPAQRPAEVTRADLARLVLEAEAELAVERGRNAELEPKAAMHDALMVAEGDWSVREAAQMLARDPSIAMGQTRLFAYLKRIRWIDANKVPYQRQVDMGRVRALTRTYEHEQSGEMRPWVQVRITPKGLSELHKLLNGSAPIEHILSTEVDA